MTSSRLFLLSLPLAALSLGVGCAPSDSSPIAPPKDGGTGGASSGTGGSGTGGSGTGGAMGSGGSSVDMAVQDLPPAVDMPVDIPVEMPPTGELCTNGDCTALVGGFDNFFIDGKCRGPKQGPDCVPDWCAGSANTMMMRNFPMMGALATPGGVYELTLRVRGVQECKRYQGGTRDPADGLPISQEQKQWYVGGTVPASPYNSQELHVMPPVVGAASNDYFLNACGANQNEGHYTYLVNYEAKMRINGGGTIGYKQIDSNCRQINNCGTAEATAACPANQHVVNMNSPSPPIPAFNIAQPITNAEGARGQFMHVDVTSIKKIM